MLDKYGVLHSEFPDVELPNQNLWQFLYPQIKKWGNLTAYVNSETEESTSYKELLDRSLCWAKELKKFFKGSKPPLVAFILENSLEYVPLVTGCNAVGAPFCSLKHNTTKDLLYLMVLQTKPAVIVAEQSLLDNFKEIIQKTGVDPTIYIKGPKKEAGDGYKNVVDVLLSGDMLELSEAGKYDPASTAMILYSSGTTGNPKAIVLSHKSLTNSTYVGSRPTICPIRFADEAEQETLLANLPLAHGFGIAYYCIVAPLFGNRMVHFLYDTTEDLVRHIKIYKPKFLPSRTYTIEEMSTMDCADDISSLRTIMVVGSPPNYDALKNLNEQLVNKIFIQEGYGATECGLISITPLNQPRFGMSGKLASNCLAKFIDTETGETIKDPHKTGLILCKCPYFMDGYLDNPEATKEAIDSEGWYHTGDIGYFDEDYYFRVIDRANDFITVGNKKISPSKFEFIIKQHPSVIDAGVVGIPDAATGTEVPKAFIIRKGTVEAEDIIRFVEERAPEEMRLTGGVTFVENLLRNHMGKLVRKFIREMEWFQ